ncbi:MAG: NTP transferase domain-containing protein [Dehalococcoidia bacterium]
MKSSIVLAAGISSRMGEPKALLDWGGQPLVCYQVEQLRAAGVDEVIVVLGFKSDEIHRQMKRADCRVMLNPRFMHGRAGSLRIGAKAVNRDAESIVILNVDQPRPASLIRRVLDAHKPEFIATRPGFDGHHGHPVVVSGALRPDLLSVTDENDGLRGILRARIKEIQEVPGDATCLVDFNTPEEYQSALSSYFATA